MNKREKEQLVAIKEALKRDLFYHNKNLTKTQYYTVDAIIETLEKMGA